METTLTFGEAVTRRLGLDISYRQLDHWCRRGYLHPLGNGDGTGRDRWWPEAELEVARSMGRLVGLGLTVEAAHRAARAGREVWVTWALGYGPVPLPDLD